MHGWQVQVIVSILSVRLRRNISAHRLVGAHITAYPAHGSRCAGGREDAGAAGTGNRLHIVGAASSKQNQCRGYWVDECTGVNCCYSFNADCTIIVSGQLNGWEGNGWNCYYIHHFMKWCIGFKNRSHRVNRSLCYRAPSAALAGLAAPLAGVWQTSHRSAGWQVSVRHTLHM
jgi:hypothetical protein